MNRNFLLTYETSDTTGKQASSYDWFETEKDMREFIEDEDISVIEAIEVTGCREIDLEAEIR
jgi:hypothetical protein